MKAKNITKLIFILGIIVVTLGTVRGMHLYKENEQTPKEQQVAVLTNNTTGDSCIITVSGNKYDVTNFRYVHEGGNVFKCGEDMTEVFKKAHGGYTKMIEKFKVQ